jgi:hypothetical protein
MYRYIKMALSLSEKHQHKILTGKNDKPMTYLGVGDFEVHTMESLRLFSKFYPNMIYPRIIKKLKKSGEKSVKITFTTVCESFVNEFLDFKYTYGNFIDEYDNKKEGNDNANNE